MHQTPSCRDFWSAAALATLPVLSRAVPAGPDAFRYDLTPVCLTSDLELLARLKGHLERPLQQAREARDRTPQKKKNRVENPGRPFSGRTSVPTLR